MRALSLETPGRFRMMEADPPNDPGPGEALVRVRSVGICGSDLRAFEGRQTFFAYPRILGHELGVEIVALEKTDRVLSVGDRCAVEPYMNCGACAPCRSGRTNCCVRLSVLGVHVDGGMQEYLLAIDTSDWTRHQVPASQTAEVFPEWLDTERNLLKPILEW